MAESLYQFDVDDDSPEIAYFPFVNPEPSQNVTAGWQLLYTYSGAANGPGQVGVGTSSHYTSLDGASLLINWNGTGIVLFGSVGSASYSISLDGVPSVYSPADTTTLASFNDLENTNHSLLLTTIITNSSSPEAYLAFDKARITYAPPSRFVNTTNTSQTIPDSDIAFMGSWSYVADSTGYSMHVSNSAGDRADVTFQGSAITIYGFISSYSGNFSVTVDNTTTNLSAQSSYNNSDALLFYATDLPQDAPHLLSVINQENRTLALQVGGMNVTAFGNVTTIIPNSSTRNSLSAGTIAAIVLGIVLFLVVLGILYYACCIRRKVRPVSRNIFLHGGRNRCNEKGDAGIEQVTYASPPSGEEIESTSLSTSKGYGFGLGLRRGFPFTYRKSKSKIGSSSSGISRHGTGVHAELHPMTFRDRDEKHLSINTLTENYPAPTYALESEKLAPGWCNPVAHTSASFKYGRRYKEAHGVILPELRMDQLGPVDDDYDDDADVKTLTSRQDETLAATLSLSPRTSEVASAVDGGMLPKFGIDTQDISSHSHEIPPPELLQVRDTSPFRVDVSAVFGSRKGNRDSRTTSGSGGSTWSKVRSRLYRRAHRDDGRQSYHANRRETSSSSGPESVPVVMHESGSANPPSETAPGSGTYSFLDLTSSHVSLWPQSKSTTLSSTPAELGHGAKEGSTWSENTSIRMVRVERSRDVLSPKPDAPSTASGGSPSDDSGTQTVPSVPTTTHTQRSSAFPFPITIPPPTDPIPPTVVVPEHKVTPSLPPTPPFPPDQYLPVPHTAPPELSFTSASSPTESVPFSVSDIHFRHSFSDYAALDSRRGSATSVLPPHPPLPHIDGSQASTPTYTPPPPYIVQRVLGLPMSPLSPLTSAALAATRTPSRNVISSTSNATHPGTAPIAPVRVSSLMGPRPRPTTAGSVRGTAAPQLPMQGGRGGFRTQR